MYWLWIVSSSTIKKPYHKSSSPDSHLNLGKNGLDLSGSTASVLGGSNAVVDLGSGVYAMYCGDNDGNGQIQNSDISSVANLLGNSGYNAADLDMNGQIQNSDINNLLNPNLGKGEQF